MYDELTHPLFDVKTVVETHHLLFPTNVFMFNKDCPNRRICPEDNRQNQTQTEQKTVSTKTPQLYVERQNEEDRIQMVTTTAAAQNDVYRLEIMTEMTTFSVVGVLWITRHC